jgi:3-hydroxybutyryl-CoA dehydrogenase
VRIAVATSAPAVVVVGTGTMAPGIAAACAAAGASVTVAGRDAARTARAAVTAGVDVHAAAIEPEAFAGRDLVVETVVEDIAVKRELLSRIEAWVAVDTVIATNTSSLTISSLASALERPGRLAGLHFLNPAAVTAVVEVVPGPATTPATIEFLSDFSRRMGKTPLVLRRDYPGFIWNRLQMAMIRECIHLLDEGVADLAAVEAAVCDGLAPRWLAAGPLATTDLGGGRTFRIVAEELFHELSTTGHVSERLGPGFYAWTEETAAAVRELRADALGLVAGVAQRRRDVTPEAMTPGGGSQEMRSPSSST